MISKVLKPSKSFTRVCSYLLHKREHAEVIFSSGIRTYDYRKMAEDFNLQASVNPTLSSPVQHIILAFPPTEKITEETQKLIVQEYLQELRIDQTQFVVVCHQDKSHTHLHIVLNRIAYNGKTIKDSFLGLRAKKKAQELTLRHGLQPAVNKKHQQIFLRQKNSYDYTRFFIGEVVLTGLGKTNNFHALENYLKLKGIQVAYKYKSQSKEVQGISFKMGIYTFKGSAISRYFSYNKISHFFIYKKGRENILINDYQNSLTASQRMGAEELFEWILKTQEETVYVPKKLQNKKKRKRSKKLGL